MLNAPRAAWQWPAFLVTLWGVAIGALASLEWFRQAPQIPSRFGLAVMLPPNASLTVWRCSKRLHACFGSRDLGLIIRAQSWRALGMVFLFLWALESLPIAFALPDMMQSLPMIPIPACGLPPFIILHLIAWIKLRQEAAP